MPLFITARDNVKRHTKKLGLVPFVYKMITAMAGEGITPFAEQGRRLRWLREAEGFPTGTAFAAYMNWGQSGYSQFETGKRRVPMDKALQLRDRIVGFDLTWLWTGDKRGLAFDLRQRIEQQEAKDLSAQSERQDVGG